VIGMYYNAIRLIDSISRSTSKSSEDNELNCCICCRQVGRGGGGRGDGGRGDVPVPAGRAARRGVRARAPPHARLPQGPRCQVRARQGTRTHIILHTLFIENNTEVSCGVGDKIKV
jgi:hypothetical protein